MKVIRLIIGGISYKLVKAKNMKIDDFCSLCSLSDVCLRLKEDEYEPRFLCDMGGRAETADTFFVVDFDIDKTIKEVMDEEL